VGLQPLDKGCAGNGVMEYINGHIRPKPVPVTTVQSAIEPIIQNCYSHGFDPCGFWFEMVNAKI
jgi:hypothetical protein